MVTTGCFGGIRMLASPTAGIGTSGVGMTTGTKAWAWYLVCFPMAAGDGQLDRNRQNSTKHQVGLENVRSMSHQNVLPILLLRVATWGRVLAPSRVCLA